ncbi:sn-glycerol-3-phosphate ABC transporter substrate-binding protein UgpB [Salinisphaera sp. RV14]|uniref:sn-glycerol-3-phosphate ABC transporter substrate-binding protein UgpB n=1 Tax=Salinisphaera sp. RV14 TaxID=3454140 RepID=UPI003F877D18
MKQALSAAVIALALVAAGAQARAADKPIQITWWHSMAGKNGETLDHLVSEFNHSQSKYHVDAVYKGNYSQSLTSAMAAFRAHKQPDLLQVFEVGTATMMAATNAIVPVYKLMAQHDVGFKPDAFIPSVKGYYTDSNGHMLSMPFNSSTPVLYYNRDEFKQAGLKRPPKTWSELGDDAKKLRDAGVKCGFTTAWQSWIQIENFAAWQNQPLATEDDGFKGMGARLLINKKPFVEHIGRMASWTRNNLFQYGGREDSPMPLFYSGNCAMLFQSSGSFGSIQNNAKFDVGVAPMPYDKRVVDQPQNSIIGGASLWVLQGQPKSHYQGVAEFLNFLAQPKQQAEWSRNTGYVPVTETAYQLLKKQGFYNRKPGAEVAIKELTLHPPTANSKGLRLGNYNQIRNIINAQLEAVWSGQKSARQALDSAVKRGNAELEKFQNANS